MGRCYEFGTSINPDCEHGMVVVDEGGACRCPVCDTLCRGRFAGCAEIVSRPGYVSPLAPPTRKVRTSASAASVAVTPIAVYDDEAPPSMPTVEEVREELERALLEEFRTGISAVVR